MRLLVAALNSELVGFPLELPGFSRLVTGPGKLKAAVELTRALERGEVDEIVVVGTAGQLDAGLAAGVHEISAALQHDVTDLDGIVGQHVSLPSTVETGHPGVVIATGDRFIDDADAVVAIRELGAQLVDMETFAYIWVAHEYAVPIRVFKAISDSAQDGATQLWDETVAHCSAQLYTHLAGLYGA
ncbi:MAG: nucleoside phosphorylase [Microbacterium sp.]|jgi:adenosylhomocysteine nucleosidase|uniref:5'-methylthioadenosine/S-adenosylhomocysteine nucleosidase n=2 Tax=Bacteria TaxID=2 RepID=A0A0F0LSA3_9MICO|nr:MULTISPECIES: nucleoside phosphorylase [Microbacterium]MAL06526.1 nucleoside phosphorylase [Microbacterium sp.]MCK9919828.1 nucleoside phosphorylase [Microbacteriaceae bacterium K1510]KJL36117.1 5'-methylthioadenosine/S-adenosylhomocysteine nucleosidase [Microbacterium ginsengisoli]KQR93959.1 nucleoside phosphorylase [Microbacterium sp. Leaf347]KQR97171.1 nucleoside phosphorylase [Microbacterium sp. Leaf351]